MCSIVLRIAADGVLIGANRDEMLTRPWDPPGRYWPAMPGVVAGRDRLGGGTWLGINQSGLMAAVLNRRGTLGPETGKHSRGELPLLALREAGLDAATAKIRALDAADYRGFNLILADGGGAVFLRGLETGAPEAQSLPPGTWMITSGEANDLASPRIARHLPKFAAAPASAWAGLLADNTPPEESAINIPPRHGFGTVCSAIITLSRASPPRLLFAPGPPHSHAFRPVALEENAPPE